MITEDYCNFETAKLLKEKGFKIPYDSFRGVYINGIFKRLNPGDGYGYNTGDEIVEVCSLQMAMKWLREVHKINIEVCLGFDADSKLGYFYNPVISDLKNMALAIETPEFDETEFTVYEEAAEAAIKDCLENLI